MTGSVISHMTDCTKGHMIGSTNGHMNASTKGHMIGSTNGHMNASTNGHMTGSTIQLRMISVAAESVDQTLVGVSRW